MYVITLARVMDVTKLLLSMKLDVWCRACMFV